MPHPPVGFNRLVALAAFGLTGCVFLPETTTAYDRDCDIVHRHMRLKTYQVAGFAGCQNEGCLQLLALSGVVSATSLVISGSIAVVGDIVYWLEAKAHCIGKSS